MTDTEPTPRITRKTIIGCTAAELGMTKEDITGQGRFRKQVLARWICVLLIREFEPAVSRPQLGEVLGGRDHTTMIHAIRGSARMLATDPAFAAQVEACRARVLAWRPTAPQTVNLAVGAYDPPPEAKTPPAVKIERPTAKPKTDHFWNDGEPADMTAMREGAATRARAFAAQMRAGSAA